MLCTEVHEQREKVRGVGCMREGILQLFACFCDEKDLCLCVIMGVFIPPILLKMFLKGRKRNEMGINIPEFVQ
jgi:hypothetical protein